MMSAPQSGEDEATARRRRRAEQARKRYQSNPVVAAKAKAQVKAWRHNPENRALWRAQKTRARRRKGAEAREHIKSYSEEERLQRQITALAIGNARDAFRHWIRVKAPDAWVRAYYEESGKPWNNPRLSEGTAYTLRYRLDVQFRRREYERHLEKKRLHRDQIRRTRSVSLDREREIRAEATHCRYCGCELTESNRTLDHVQPLSKGGEHSEMNLVGACLSCNSRKQDKSACHAPSWGCG